MSEKKRVLFLVLIMAASCMAVVGTTIAMLYHTAFEEQREVLSATAKSQARLIESMAGFDEKFEPNYQGGSEEATLDQIIRAHRRYPGIAETGEFVLAKHEGNDIVFLLRHRHHDFDTPKSVSMKSKVAEPMRRALSGKSGTMIGLDYRGARVLAAYELVAGPNWGIVAKIDLSEIRAPFIKAGIVSLIIAMLVIVFGAWLFIRITGPIMKRLKEHAQQLTKLVGSLKQSEENLQEAKEELEIRVDERTSELVSANARLEVEVHERTQAEERLQSLWKIAEMVDADEKELCDHILIGALRMTQSRYAFYGFMNLDESVLSVYSWSKEALKKCSTLEHPVEFPVAKAGIWAEAVRQRQVIMVNDYQAEHPDKRGLPAGHVPLTRILVVPVFIRDRIVAIVAAANKATDYTPGDVKQLEAFANGVQVILNQRKMEEALRTSEKECRLLSRQVIEAQEKERKRVAREIHDGIGQSLAAIKFHTECFSLKTEAEPAAIGRELESTIHMIQDTMEEVRRIQNDLRPAYLDELGVLESIVDFCETFQETYSGINIDMQIDLSENDVPELIKVPMFRISQEAMNNAAKHSSASRIFICIQKTQEGIRLTVEDNGVGFETEDGRPANAHGKGLGLYSMKERAELSHGFFELASAPGKGTTVRATWRLESVAQV